MPIRASTLCVTTHIFGISFDARWPAAITLIPLAGCSRTNEKSHDALDDNDDVQKVYANFDIDASEME